MQHQWITVLVGYIRIVQPALQLLLKNSLHVNITALATIIPGKDWLFTQRVCWEPICDYLIKVKDKTKTKVCVDYDDILWTYKGESIPTYNFTKIKYKSNTEVMKKYLDKVADKITVSTETLRDSLLQFVPKDKIEIIPNMLTRTNWLFPRDLTGSKLPLSFMYAGSATHFDNVNKIYGDWTVEWDKYLQDKSVSIQGICPWFIKPTRTYPWVGINEYALNFYYNTRNTKFIIATLADNIFNKCKSDLKYLESAAVGRVCLVSDFERSPYEFAHPLQKIPINATAKQIANIIKMCEDNYNEILEYQYEYLNRRWLENCLGRYESIFNNIVSI